MGARYFGHFARIKLRKWLFGILIDFSQYIFCVLFIFSKWIMINVFISQTSVNHFLTSIFLDFNISFFESFKIPDAQTAIKLSLFKFCRFLFKQNFFKCLPLYLFSEIQIGKNLQIFPCFSRNTLRSNITYFQVGKEWDISIATFFQFKSEHRVPHQLVRTI